jgi:DNA helicase-2/ATP-dependent DNA helicase PcrA
LEKEKDVAFNDFAILCRTNEAANMFSRALERARIPFQFLSSKGLYSKPMILDIISYFKLLDNYYESSAVYRVLNAPCFKVAYNDIVRINQYSKRKARSIYEAMEEIVLIPDISEQTQQKISHILGLLKKHGETARKKNISEVFVEFLQDSGYLEYLTKNNSPEKIKENLDLINQFYDKIKQFEDEQMDPKLSSFIQQIDMELESGDEGSLKFNLELGDETVKIMTIHSAKGLEFKYVFLVNLVDKRFPSIERKEPIEIPEALVKEVLPQGDVHLQEERRLFYVAMTRAKKGLFFTFAKDYGLARMKKPSRFLIETGIVSSKSKAQNPNYSKTNPKSKLFQNKSKIQSPKQISDSDVDLTPDHFSYSQLADFEKCPLQYKFKYILRIPVKGKAVFTFGTTMHNTLYDFVNKAAQSENISQNQLFGQKHVDLGSPTNFEVRFEELLEIYKNNWKDEWFEDAKEKEKYYKLGKDSLKIFYDNFIKTKPKIKIIQDSPALEKDFRLKFGDYVFVGKIDRIDETDGGVEIIDYKTGKSKTKLKPNEKEQLLIYQIAAEKVFNLCPKKLSYHYLDNGTKVSFLATEKDKQDVEKKIKDMIGRIKQSDFQPNPSPFNCKYCDFRNICEFRKL